MNQMKTSCTSAWLRLRLPICVLGVWGLDDILSLWVVHVAVEHLLCCPFLRLLLLHLFQMLQMPIFVQTSQREQQWRPKAPEHQEFYACAIAQKGVEQTVNKGRGKIAEDVFDDLSSWVSKGTQVRRNRWHHNSSQPWHHGPSEEKHDP